MDAEGQHWIMCTDGQASARVLAIAHCWSHRSFAYLLKNKEAIQKYTIHIIHLDGTTQCRSYKTLADRRGSRLCEKLSTHSEMPIL